MTRRDAPSKRWCAEGLPKATCCENHVRAALPVGPGRGRKRQCPICHGNLSVNPGTEGWQWIIWNCLTGQCDRALVRAALEDQYRVHPLCLGDYASDEYEARKRGQRERPAVAPSYSARPDSATYLAAQKWWAAQKLIGSGMTNGSLVQVCLQAISEGDGTIPGDPKLLLPRDQDALAALARRAGFNQVHAWKLAHNWLAQLPAEVTP